MSHSKAKIWVHAILGVKKREKLIKPQIEKKIHNLVKEKLINLKCYVEEINGTADHAHVLFLLNKNKTLAEVMQLAKGSVTHEINQKKIADNKFSWQVGYGAFSVSESQIQNVKNYIKNQKKHHKIMTFEDEYERFLKLHGV